MKTFAKEMEASLVQTVMSLLEGNKVRQTACRHCGQDIEGFHPYRKGEWRDRGNNTTCPDKSGKTHAPYIDKPQRTTQK